MSGSVKFWGIWAATEQKAFQKVIDGFHKQYPNVTVTYSSKGNDIPTVLSTAIAGGNPPDMADVAQPGLVKQLVQQGKLKPINVREVDDRRQLLARLAEAGRGQRQALRAPLQGDPTSRPSGTTSTSSSRPGSSAPKTWSQMVSEAKTIKASGTPAYSLCGANGWTLTDIFENIYLRRWGQAKYDQLSAHQIKWTDSTVTQSLKDMAQVIGDTGNIYGGTSGALQTDYPTCVDYAFATPPKAAFNLQGDFVSLEILQATKSKPVKDFNVVPFPAITSGANASAIETSGDEIITFRDTPAIQAFMKYLATPQAAEIWAKLGGFGTGNMHVPASVYPDSITRATETPLAKAKAAVFDMSDEQPASFGATTGQGEWGIFQKFLQNPSSISSIQQQLESSAAKAYSSGK